MGVVFLKESFVKSSNLKNQEKNKETEFKKIISYDKANTEKAKDKLNGVLFSEDKKEDVFKGCFFAKEE